MARLQLDRQLTQRNGFVEAAWTDPGNGNRYLTADADRGLRPIAVAVALASKVDTGVQANRALGTRPHCDADFGVA
jgi:hypothetical protein